jgi:hypothetical protein
VRRAALIAVVAGFLVGTFLAGLPHAENEQCGTTLGGMSEGSGYSGTWGRLWPYAGTCEFTSNGRQWTVSFGAGVVEGIGWVALASLLFALAIVKRSPAARGAATAATLLAVLGFLWQFGGELAAAGMVVVTFGPAIVYAVLRRLGHGGRTRCLMTAIALTLAVLIAWSVPAFAGFPYAAVAAGLLAGAGVTASRRPAPAPLPAR